MSPPRLTIAVPSFNQGRFLDCALESIFRQELATEVFLMDGGSTDGTLEVIRKWEPRLAGWRSRKDEGQSAAINEGLALGSAPFVCWLNSDDWYLPAGLAKLLAALEANPQAPMAYGRAWNYAERNGRTTPVFVRPFDERLMAQLNLVSQPATLIRRSAWQAVGGADASLHMAMDYDLWWRLYRKLGAPAFVDDFVAVNREHGGTKTSSQRALHYREAMAVVKRYYGRVPLKWYLAQPYAVWWRTLVGR
ncbi:MAG TPA: glycosyltransferase [Usitatibacter sp.]|nr:glycosyltransferase [Usitatibacter sp.]